MCGLGSYGSVVSCAVDIPKSKFLESDQVEDITVLPKTSPCIDFICQVTPNSLFSGHFISYSFVRGAR